MGEREKRQYFFKINLRIPFHLHTAPPPLKEALAGEVFVSFSVQHMPLAIFVLLGHRGVKALHFDPLLQLRVEGNRVLDDGDVVEVFGVRNAQAAHAVAKRGEGREMEERGRRKVR